MKDKVLTLQLPLAIYLPRKIMKDKRFSLNLNTYRNAHYLVSNQAKKIFKEYIQANIPIDCPKFNKPTISYRLTKSGNRKTDLMNWVAIVDKFFLDALVELEIIPDDNTDYIRSYNIDFVGQDKEGFIEAHLYERGKTLDE